MDYIKLGDSDLKVSRICMGCMGFGDPNNGMHSWTLNKEESSKIIGHGLDKGINFFDTAIGYQNGTSEQYVGDVINDYGRDDVVVATKFLPRSQEDIKNNISGQEHSAIWLIRVYPIFKWIILTCTSIICGIIILHCMIF